jgi:hypothetical protein
MTDHILHVEEGADTPVIEVSIPDLAAGVLEHMTDLLSGREWARVLLATGMVDLTAAEGDPDFDEVVGAIWGLASGHAPSDAAVKVAHKRVD